MSTSALICCFTRLGFEKARHVSRKPSCVCLQFVKFLVLVVKGDRFATHGAEVWWMWRRAGQVGLIDDVTVYDSFAASPGPVVQWDCSVSPPQLGSIRMGIEMLNAVVLYFSPMFCLRELGVVLCCRRLSSGYLWCFSRAR